MVGFWEQWTDALSQSPNSVFVIGKYLQRCSKMLFSFNCGVVLTPVPLNMSSACCNVSSCTRSQPTILEVIHLSTGCDIIYKLLSYFDSKTLKLYVLTEVAQVLRKAAVT